MISHVRMVEPSVVAVHRDAHHGTGYGRLENYLVPHGLEILSVIVRVCSSVLLIEDRCRGLVLRKRISESPGYAVYKYSGEMRRLKTHCHHFVDHLGKILFLQQCFALL